MKSLFTALSVCILLCGCSSRSNPQLEILGAEVRVHELTDTRRCLVCDLRCRYTTGKGAIVVIPSGHEPAQAPDVTYVVKGDKSIQRLWIELAGTQTDASQDSRLTAAQKSATVTTGREFSFGETREHVLLSYTDLEGRQVTYAFVYEPSRDWSRQMGVR